MFLKSFSFAPWAYFKQTKFFRNFVIKSNLGYREALSAELKVLDLSLRPTRDQFMKRKIFLEKVKPLLEDATGGKLVTFGSCATGFWTVGSDVDACLVLPDATVRAAWLSQLRYVTELLEQRGITKSVIIPAQVPIAKMLGDDGRTLCDVSVNNTVALDNSLFVKIFANLDSRIPPLGRFIKHWAARRQINDRSLGTISTYALMLQIFFFLQTREIPILPTFKELEYDYNNDALSIVQRALLNWGVDENKIQKSHNESDLELSFSQTSPIFYTNTNAIVEYMKLSHAPNQADLGDLIYDFFMLFGDKAFSGIGRGVSLHVYDKTYSSNSMGIPMLICPITQKNVNPFTSSTWQILHTEYQRAKSLLLAGKSLEELCEPSDHTPLVEHQKGKVSRLIQRQQMLGKI